MHKFQMCKEDKFTNFKYDYTWQHDSLTKLGFINFANLIHVIFERSCKLHQISYATTTNYLWLFLITFIKWSPIIWKSHYCAYNMLNSSCFYSTHTCHGLPSQMTSWQNFSKHFAFQSSPTWHLLAFPLNMPQISKLFDLAWSIIKGNI
jgi:hypothetical protein